MTELKKFLLINKIEGYSFLILLFIAMPLKYMLEIHMATKIAGMTHGILFLLFTYQLIMATSDVPFSKKDALIFFVLSFIPFGSFYINHLTKKKYT